MSTCLTPHLTCTFSVALMALTAPVVANNTLGPDWDGDNIEDAGNKPETAQKVESATSNSVLRISGKLKGEDKSGGLAGEDVGDFQDMYAIVVTEPGQFVIHTLPPFGSAEFDSILTVYDYNGLPLLANDDADDNGSGSLVGSCTTDGAFCITSPGTIYIAISGADSRPLAENGENAFAWNAGSTGIVGSAGNGPIANWTFPGETGEYVIALEAAGPIPPECGAQNTDSCFEAHALPYCSTPGCCEAVCSIDQFCCQVTWDAVCVQQANLFCGGSDSFLHCGDNDAGSCNIPHSNPFCKDPACCASVCAMHPNCCESSWDETCVNIAEKICSNPCNEQCPPDLDYDLIVSGSDLALLLGNWGQPGCTDLDGNGITNGADITILLVAWGDSCSE